METIIDFLTSKTGIFAAIAAFISIVGGILGIVRPWLKERQEKQLNIPSLGITALKVTPPPPWSEAGEVSFQLVNTQGGKAVMTEMWLIVLEHGPSEKIKKTQPAAPVPQYTYKVKLRTDANKYNVREKKFGPKPQPQSFGKSEVESYIIELTSNKPQWYKFRLEMEWYDIANKDELKILQSPELSMEFAPDEKKT
jgi:hypothetical protein